MYIYVLHTGYRGTYEPTCNPFACKKFACCAPPRHFYYYYKVHVPTLACRPHAAPLVPTRMVYKDYKFYWKARRASSFQFFPLFLSPLLPYFTLKARYDIGERDLPSEGRIRHDAISYSFLEQARIFSTDTDNTFTFIPGFLLYERAVLLGSE